MLKVRHTPQGQYIYGRKIKRINIYILFIMYNTHMLWIPNSIKIQELRNFWVGGMEGGRQSSVPHPDKIRSRDTKLCSSELHLIVRRK